MRLILFSAVFYVLIHHFHTSAQPRITHAEELFEYTLKKYPQDTVRMKVLLDTANRIIYNNPDTAIKISRRVSAIALKNNLKLYHAKAEVLTGVAFKNIGYEDSALTHYLNAVQLFQEANHNEGLAVSYVNLANLYSDQENWQNALYYYKKAESIFQKNQNKMALGTILLNIGNTYFKRKKWDSCETYYLLAEKYLSSFKNYPNTQLTMANLAHLYIELKQYPKAQLYAEKTIQLNPQNIKYTAAAHFVLAQVYFHQNNLTKAELYAKIAIHETQQIKETEKRTETHLFLSKIYEAKQQYKDALTELKTVISLKDSIFDFTLKTQRENVLKKLEHLNYKIHITEAIQKTEEQRKVILFQRTILFLCIVFLFVTGILLFLFYNKNQLLKQANYSIELKNAVLQEQKQTIEHLNQNLEKMVEERTQELEKRNQRLKEYADYNAHILRAPLARILGLFEIYKEAKTIQEKEQILAYLNETANELDVIVREMQGKLQNK